MSFSDLHLCLLFSSALFCVGLIGVLARSNTILVLLGVELMLNAANINFIAFWRFGPRTSDGCHVCPLRHRRRRRGSRGRTRLGHRDLPAQENHPAPGSQYAQGMSLVSIMLVPCSHLSCVGTRAFHP